MKKNSALDLNGDWTVLSSVTAKGSDQVVFQFSKPAVPYFYYIADETPIVPEHIWSSIKDPVTYLDKTPIGTGPYTLQHVQRRQHPVQEEPQLLAEGTAARSRP